MGDDKKEEKCMKKRFKWTCRDTCGYCEDQCPIVQIGNSIEGDYGDWFGNSVSISANGMTLAIGGPYNDGNGRNSGHVRVFNLDSNQSWIQISDDLHGSDAGDLFGESVSLSNTGNRLAVSSSQNDNANGENAGCVRVYHNDGGKWIQLGTDVLGLAEGDQLMQVALSGDGDCLAISMPYNDDNGDTSGKVQVYQLKNKHWTLLGNNDVMHGLNIDDWFGYDSLSISFDGKTVTAGSYVGDYVQVFTLVNGLWTLLGGVIYGEGDEEGFGSSVALSGDGRRAVIGASESTNGGLEYRGRVAVYDYIKNNDMWVMIGQSLWGEDTWDFFGDSVSISGDGKRIAVGGIYNGGNGVKAGHVRVFDFDEDNSQWNQIAKDIDGDSAYDVSGRGIALSNDANFLAIGAPAFFSNGDKIGSVRVYEVQQCQE